ncbi:MAG TPA: GNAT family protein [Salinisphaeraceae bacterium]|nr:GNAT family protein [Salinisphaeraceae bacterium]
MSEWMPPPRPGRTVLTGRYCRVEPLTPERHADDLYSAIQLDTQGTSWTYLPYGPFATAQAYRQWLGSNSQSEDPLFFALVDSTSDKALGVASYLRINPASGSIEVGHIHLSPLLQRRVMATEAMFLLMQNAFALGYRRYEWKCDALNAASRAAAQRLGLSYEGISRQATVYKGRNRDTAWYAATDNEWPILHEAFTRWLHPDNFDAQGRQRSRLRELTAPLLRQHDQADDPQAKE